jgi:hypothetical protein
MRMLQVDTHTVGLLLGHRMAQRYQHLSPGFLSDAVARLDGVFGSLVSESDLEVTKLEESTPSLSVIY